MGPQRRLGIYIDIESPSILNCLEPSTRDLFTVRFVDCHFDETVSLTLGGDKKENERLVQEERRELLWNTPTLSHLDPRTPQCEY